MHAPFHKYLGPGTDLRDSETPADLDDQIAKEHDLAYAEGGDAKRIRLADEHAASDFIADFHDSGNVHSAVSSIGLSAKALIERGLGNIYGATASSHNSMPHHRPPTDSRGNRYQQNLGVQSSPEVSPFTSPEQSPRQRQQTVQAQVHRTDNPNINIHSDRLIRAGQRPTATVRSQQSE